MKKIFLILASLFILQSCQKNEKTFDASGSFEAEEVIVSAQQSGQLLLFPIHEGDLLQKNQTVGSIDVTDLLLQKAQVQASIGSLQEKLNTPAPQINVVKKQLAVQQTQLGSLQKEKNRVESLLKAEAATQKQFDDISAKVEEVKKQLAVSEEQIELYNATVNTQNRAVLSEKNPLQKKVAQVDELIRKGKIINPIKGTVLTKYALEGEMAGIGKALYKIANLDTMTLRVYVTGRQLPSTQLGQVVKVKIDNGEAFKEYKGKIFWISDKAEFTPKTIQTKEERQNLVYAVKISVPNDGFLKIGMYGEMLF